MSNRRASDGDPFHTSAGLFNSALILGLYVFMIPLKAESTAVSPNFNLIDNVDWDIVGSKGLTDENANVPADDAAVNFIRNRGGICFDGVIHQPGYEAARRILHGGWKILGVGEWGSIRFRVCWESWVMRLWMSIWKLIRLAIYDCIVRSRK
jgi:hypothetical protein